MNLSTAAMLLNKSIRPLKVEYDPDTYKNNNPFVRFKTTDQTIKKDDLVVVTTTTRHGFTIAKVIECDFPVDFNSPDQWGWAHKFDKAQHERILDVEKQIIARVAENQENKMRKELMDAQGLGEVSFTDLDLMQVGTPKLAAPAAEPYAAKGEEAVTG